MCVESKQGFWHTRSMQQMVTFISINYSVAHGILLEKHLYVFHKNLNRVGHLAL